MSMKGPGLFGWLFRAESDPVAQEELRLMQAREQMSRMRDDAARMLEIQHRVKADLDRTMQELRREQERVKLMRERVRYERAFDEATSDPLYDPAWARWKIHLGEAPCDRDAVRELADKLWYEAGMPEDQDIFWDEAQKRLTQRALGEKGYSGACMTDSELAKQTALQQFLRRRKAAIKHGIIENSSIPAGMPMVFYCKHCGILVETLPEDYIFSPRHQCSQCKGLDEMNWLSEAKRNADSEGLHLPSPKRYDGKESLE